MLLLFLIPIIVINSGIVTNIYLLFGLFAMAGIGQAGVGMGIMHDANHGSYSSNRKINKLMGYSMNLIGANSTLWKVQHNVLHHTYTNIDTADDDIRVPGILRLSPHAKKYWIHRFQHYYAWFLYGLSTIPWVVSKDFINIFRYKKMGLIKERKEILFLKVFGWKVIYLSYTFIIPLLILPFEPWLILLSIFTMHFVTGLGLSIVFQTAHIMPSSEFPVPDKDGMIKNEWFLHQMATTCNFSPKSRLFSWFIGGLNYQIEHHLLPHVSHVHYRKISGIVSNTAREFDIPYHSKKTFLAALWDHAQMLRQLGRMELQHQ